MQFDHRHHARDDGIDCLYYVYFNHAAHVNKGVAFARWLDTLAAIWLFFATLAIFHTQAGTLWNNLIVAVVVFILSFVGGTMGERQVGVRRPVGA